MANDHEKGPSSVEAFGDEIDRLVERFRAEWDLSYGEAVGVLFFKAHDLCREAGKSSGD